MMNRSSALQRTLASLGWSRASDPRRDSAALVPHNAVAAKIGYLQEVAVFAPLSAEEHHWLATNTTMVTCEQGRIFYTPDDQGEVIFILKRGKVNLYRMTPEGRKLVVATLTKGTFFGEMDLLGQAMYDCYAEAAEDCLLCVLSQSDLRTLIRRNPDVGLQLLSELGTRLRQREAALEAIAFRSISARLAALLLAEADIADTVAGQSHQDLAERLGTYRETVSQALGRFRDQGLVAIEPRRIRLLDRSGLEAVAEE